MDKTSINKMVQEIFCDVFDDEKLVINNETSAADIDGWDSLAQIRLTLAIEKEFGVKFDFKELVDMHNVGDMLELIGKKINALG